MAELRTGALTSTLYLYYGPQWTVYEPGLDYFVDMEGGAISLVVAWMDPAV